MKIGVAFFDNTTLQFHVGTIEDDFQHSKLKALLCQLRPKEIIIDKDYISLEMIKIIKSQPLTPDICPVCIQKDKLSSQRGLTLAVKYFGTDHTQWPDSLQVLRGAQSHHQHAWVTFSMLVHYL